MSILVIQHPVRDFQAWKKAFDNDPAGRAQNGVTRHAIYALTTIPTNVVVNLEFSSREQAQAFLDHPAMRQAWKSFLGWKLRRCRAAAISGRASVPSNSRHASSTRSSESTTKESEATP